MLGHGARLTHRSWQGALQGRTQSSGVHVCSMWKCYLQSGHQGYGQARAGSSFKESPALAMAPSSISCITADDTADESPAPCGSEDEFPPLSASQTIIQAADQRLVSVEYPFCLHSVSHALIIVLIKTLLILTSPLVPPLSCSDLIFLAKSDGVLATKSHPLCFQQDLPAPVGYLAY